MVSDADLKQVMQRWTTGVSIVTVGSATLRHGMTVNSLASVSLKPPAVAITLANLTRTKSLLESSGYFGVNILSEDQKELSEKFAGRIREQDDRFAGLEVTMTTNFVPFLTAASAQLECKVIHRFEMPESTLYIGEVIQAVKLTNHSPLVYFNRDYHRIEK